MRYYCLSLVSKKKIFSWNYISQEKAIKVSENMYNKEGTSVTSQLIDSYAWDTIVEWMQKNENGIATSGSGYPPSCRSGTVDVTSYYSDIGFRVALYIM